MSTETISQVHCQRCGFDWYPRLPRLPRMCANCGSRAWQRPKPATAVEGRPAALDGVSSSGASAE